MTTLAHITDVVVKTLAGATYSADAQQTYVYVQRVVLDAINSVLRVQAQQPTRIGMVDIPACAQVTVETPVTEVAGLARASILYHPLTLPMDMGIFRVAALDNPFAPFVPVPAGFGFTLGQISHSRIAAVLNEMICYERHGDHIVFNKPASDVGPSVNITYLGMNPNDAKPTDIIPLSVDLESRVIEEALRILGVERPVDERGDGVTVKYSRS